MADTDATVVFEQLGPEGRRPQGPDEVNVSKGCVYFGNRICPFAHRAWWALNEKELSKEVDYIHVELGENKPKWYGEHFNPAATVPCMYVDGRPVFESAILVEFLEEKYPGKGARLMPVDPVERAAVRVFTQAIDVKPIYVFLMNTDRDKDAECAAAMDAMLTKLEAAYAKQSSGPFFTGADISMADISLLPFFDRFAMALKHYRNYEFWGADGQRFPRLRAAFEAAKTRPAFKATSQSPDFYVTAYSGYASGKPGVPTRVASKI